MDSARDATYTLKLRGGQGTGKKDVKTLKDTKTGDGENRKGERKAARKGKAHGTGYS
jgi:hypothetical protein